MTTPEMSDAPRPDDTVIDERDATHETQAAAHVTEPVVRQNEPSESPDPPASEDTALPLHGNVTAEGTSTPQTDELQSAMSRWREIQAGFVDEPKRAMHDADVLVTEMMERLTGRLAAEHERLESCWSEQEVSTEDLRQGLQRYRSFFERLLAT